MKFYLPTYEECKEIVEKNEAFYESQVQVDGFNVSIFNYRIAELNDFINPIPGKDIVATELRGITFIQDGDKFHRNIMLHKFFNLNQCEFYQYSDVIGNKIVRCQKKEDGSMIRFVRLPNGRIVAKTKMDFYNDQCKMAQAVYDNNPNLQSFIKETLDSGLVAIFELVSVFNKIVCKYNETELILLQLREECSGSYLDVYSNEIVVSHGVKVAKSEETILSLDEYIELSKNLEDTEGWVMTLSNGQMMKLKTVWYCNLHGLVENISKEDKIMEMVLSDTLDDAISQIDESDLRYKYAVKIQKTVAKFLLEKEKEVLSIVQDYDGDRKSWAQRNISNPLFPSAAQCLGKDNIKEAVYKSLKDRIKRDAYRLEQARAWLRLQGVSLENLTVCDE